MSVPDDPRVARVTAFFGGLQRADLARLGSVYTEGARFKDPFNDVQGLAAIRQVFAHMFETLESPRFVVLEAVVDGDTCFLTWDFRFRSRRMAGGREEQCIHGASRLRFADDGRVAEHRDYWDAAEELYEKLPLVGAAMRWLKRRAGG